MFEYIWNNNVFFFREVSVLQQNWEEGQKFPIYFLPPHICRVSPTYQYHSLINIYQHSLINILCTPPLHLSLPNSWKSLIFYSLHGFTFSRMTIVGIIQYVASSDVFLSLNNMHLIFSHFFSRLDSSFHSST